jgi:hypothetical protein
MSTGQKVNKLILDLASQGMEVEEIANHPLVKSALNKFKDPKTILFEWRKEYVRRVIRVNTKDGQRTHVHIPGDEAPLFPEKASPSREEFLRGAHYEDAEEVRMDPAKECRVLLYSLKQLRGQINKQPHYTEHERNLMLSGIDRAEKAIKKRLGFDLAA